MAVKFRKEAIKFLQKALPEDTARIQAQLNQLLISVEEQGIIPFTDLGGAIAPVPRFAIAPPFLSLAIVPVLYILIDRVYESIWKRFKVDLDRLLQNQLMLMLNRCV
jgi:hypothetical protein